MIFVIGLVKMPGLTDEMHFGYHSKEATSQLLSDIWNAKVRGVMASNLVIHLQDVSLG